MNVSPQSSVFFWAIALIIGFPLLVIVLGESIQRLRRRRVPFAATLQIFRNLVLPVLAFILFTRQVIRLEPGAFTKSLETLFWICVIHAALSLLNVLLFEQASADTWRARLPKLLIDLNFVRNHHCFSDGVEGGLGGGGDGARGEFDCDWVGAARYFGERYFWDCAAV
jgi:hypothetical protein